LIGVKDCAAAPTLADPGATIASARHTDAVANRIAAVSPSVMIFERIVVVSVLKRRPLCRFDQRIGHAKVTLAVNRTQEVGRAREIRPPGFFAGTIISGCRRVLCRIDQMNPAARRASHGFKGVPVRPSMVVGEQPLDVVPGHRATIDESCHRERISNTLGAINYVDVLRVSGVSGYRRKLMPELKSLSKRLE
jgi:hypothetical protein